MHLFFIRHAQSFNNALWDRTGNSIGRSEDPELSALGQEQAKMLADHFPAILQDTRWPDMNKDGGDDSVYIYTSLMIRAIHTGMETARAVGKNLQVWPDIHEGGGIFVEDPETGERTGQPGKERRFFEINFPELVLPSSLGPAGWWNRPHETVEECEVRARRVIDELVSRHGGSDDRVLIFSHGGFYNFFLRVLFQVPCEANIWFALNNCGITRIDFDEKETRLVYANRVDFLPQDHIS